MKKIFIISALIILICSCNDSGSSSKKSKGFSFNPETLTSDDKYNVPSTANNITFGGSVVPVNYTILFSGTVNSAGYIGIAMSDNPLSQNFNLKIYFTGTSIPEAALSINSGNSKIKAVNGAETYIWQSGTLTFNSFTKNDITTDNEKSYTTSTISISGIATLVNANNSTDTRELTFPDAITAVLATEDD